MKSFGAVALLPVIAFARGDNTGLNANDAISIELMDNIVASMTLHTYNSDNAGIDEFHGDLSLVLKEGGFSASFQEFGYCIQNNKGDTVFWDCMDVFTELLPSEIEADELYSGEFTVKDTYAPLTDVTTLPASVDQFVDDLVDDEIVNNERSWKLISAKSYKDCALDSTVDAEQQPADDQEWKVVSCPIVNAHFYRNFETSD